MAIALGCIFYFIAMLTKKRWQGGQCYHEAVSSSAKKTRQLGTESYSTLAITSQVIKSCRYKSFFT